MIGFLLKGLLRDRSRSTFPLLIVSIGVALTVILQSWIGGVVGDVVRFSANFSTGHVRITSRAYRENEDQLPNDLALLGVAKLVEELDEKYPQMTWTSRIHFGGIVDVPDEKGETRSQGPVTAMAVNLLSSDSTELKRLNLKKSLMTGRLSDVRGEVLISDDLAKKLGVRPGDSITLISSTMYGSMTMYNFIISGTLRFGVASMERGAVLLDISDAREMLDMDDGAGEILGYFKDGRYHDEVAFDMARDFNSVYPLKDKFNPVMSPLREQNDLGEYLDMASYFAGIMSVIFVVAMSIVLWNVGLLGGLRRYGEFGLRLAMGEEKGQIYRSLILESVVIGVTGSMLGTVVGLIFARYGELHGLDIGAFLKNSSMMYPNVLHTMITRQTFYIGFIPGVLSTVLGAAMSGRGVYGRETSQLFKEFEA